MGLKIFKKQINESPPASVSSIADWNWEEDEANPYNWPTKLKVQQVVMIAFAAFTTSFGTSAVAPAHTAFMKEFQVSSTVAILPLSLYTFALGLGTIVGGPLSETIGRYPVYLATTLLGSIFTLGVGFSQNFASICVLRFFAGFFYSPSLSIAGGTINETFKPIKRAAPSVIFVMIPFLGPGIGPVISSFVVADKSWRWTQWTILFFAVLTFIAILFARETFHPIIKERREKELGCIRPSSHVPHLTTQLRQFVTTSLQLPILVLVTEPIVTFICLYIACEFATLYSFFAAFPLVFQGVYRFNLEQSGLVFLGIVVGCVLGAVTIITCDILLYRPRAAKYSDKPIPPELRLFPSMIGSIGLPISLFWFGWTARADIRWASSVVSTILFAWGNICVFISTTQYLVDAYNALTVASVMSAGSLTRYLLAGAFPLFAVQMYTNLGIDWAASLLGFIAIALLPVPWVFFTLGPKLRGMSRLANAAFHT